MTDHYQTAKRAASEYAAALRRCDHPKDTRRINVGVTWEPDRFEVCWDCFNSARTLSNQYKAELKRGRKAQLDAMPRCEIETCKRRGIARWGWGADRALLCGIHGKRAERQYARTMAGPIWMPGPNLSREEVISLAVKGGAR